MSDSDVEIPVAEEATPESLAGEVSPGPSQSHNPSTTTNTQSCQSNPVNSALSSQRHDSQPSQTIASAADVGNSQSASHKAGVGQQSTTATTAATHVSAGTISNVSETTNGNRVLVPTAGALLEFNSAIDVSSDCTTSTTARCAVDSTTSTATSKQEPSGSLAAGNSNSISTSTPRGGGISGQRFPNQLTRDFTRDFVRDRGNNRLGAEEDEEEEEDGDWEELRRGEGGGGGGDMGNVAGTILGYSPLVYENDDVDGDASQLDELYVPISGYEVMEQRAKFTVFKLHVEKSPEDGYFIFRRYTDFTRLNIKLKILYPGFRLALPPKRWFGNNFDPMFLEDRMLGLQAFLNNVTGHKDIRKSTPVREFLCLNDPPGPHDSLEESRVMVESLEEVAYNLKRDVAERDRMLRRRDAEIARLKARIQELENAGLPLALETERVGTDQESESSTVEGDRRSCVEADLMDHGIPDANDEGISESVDSTLKVEIETLGKEPVKCGRMVGEGDTVAMAISQSATPAGGDSR